MEGGQDEQREPEGDASGPPGVDADLVTADAGHDDAGHDATTDIDAATDPHSTSIFDTPPADAEAVDDLPPPPPAGPTLPRSEAKPPPPMVDPISQPRPGASTWYRSDEERSKSVYRRANPWYRRLARAVIGIAFLGVAAVGLYAGARAVQNWLDRDQLPAAGAEVPEIRSTSFIVVSASPAPTLDGTLTIDTNTRAFEFVGRAGGPQSGLQVASADGTTVYIRQGAAPWRAAVEGDQVVGDVGIAVAYLADADTADEILTNRLRRGFVDLDAQIDEGDGADRLVRYEMTIDTTAFASEYPLQWQEFQDDAVPGAQSDPAAPVTIWLDADDVLMRVRDELANWSWERLTYSDQPFRPVDPANDADTRIVQVACVSDDNRVFWQTPLPSCDAALTAAADAAADAGVTFDDVGQQVAETCSAMEREDGPLPATSDEATLAAALVQAGVCRGDPTIFVTD